MYSVTSEVKIRSINPEQMKLLEDIVEGLAKKRNFWIVDSNRTGEGFPYAVLFEFEYDDGEDRGAVAYQIKILLLEVAELIIEDRGIDELDISEFDYLVGGVSNEN